MPHFKYSDEQVRNAVAESLSISEAMRKLGYKRFAGGSHFYLSKRIKKLAIDTSHFLGQRANCGMRRIGGPAQKKRASEILVYHDNGRRAPAFQLRRGLLEIGREEKCFVCGIVEWMGVRLILEIEHKDGDFQNDLQDNLEFICPNCHSQTPTFCRNKESARIR